MFDLSGVNKTCYKKLIESMVQYKKAFIWKKAELQDSSTGLKLKHLKEGHNYGSLKSFQTVQIKFTEVYTTRSHEVVTLVSPVLGNLFTAPACF